MAIFLMLLCVCATHADDNLITQQITIEVKEAGTLPNKIGKRLRVYTIVVFSFVRTFAPSF